MLLSPPSSVALIVIYPDALLSLKISAARKTETTDYDGDRIHFDRTPRM